MPWDAEKPIIPPHEEFVYSDADLCTADAPAIRLQDPPPAAPFPSNAVFPQAPVYTLIQDRRYQRGYVYATRYYTQHVSIHRAYMMSIVEPPNTAPRYLNGKYVANPIPGMVQMIPGVPYVYHINGDPNCVQTIACVQTLDFLRCYPDFQKILERSVCLAKLSWGCSAHGSTPHIPPLYTHPLKHNDRSGNRDDTSYDGSFSLANTIIKGEGQGSVAPAVQVNTPQAASQISAVLSALHDLSRLILPKCISKFENDIWEFHCEDENIVTFGGLEPGNTSCQFNVSSLGEHLTKRMGKTQGRNHNDPGDDFTFYTMFVLLLRAGPSELLSLRFYLV